MIANIAALPHMMRLNPRIASSLLLAGFCLAVALRIIIGGPQVTQSPVAGLVFACCLIILTCLTSTKLKFNWRSCAWGVLGGIFLCIPAILVNLNEAQTHRPSGDYLVWAIIVTIVALSEEAFLRGALFDVLSKWKNPNVALFVTSACFALLHVPLYGWQAAPLDFAVGLWLGALRINTGSFIAPGIAHVFADLAGWWLR